MRETRTSAQAIDATATETPSDGAISDSHVPPATSPPSPPRSVALPRSADPARPRAVSTPTQKGMPALATTTARSARPTLPPTPPVSKTTARPTVALPPTVQSAAGKTASWQSNPASLQLALRLRQGPGPALPPMPPEPPQPPEASPQKPDDPRAPNTGVDWFLGASDDEATPLARLPLAVRAPALPPPDRRPAGLEDSVAFAHPPAVPPFVEPPSPASAAPIAASAATATSPHTMVPFVSSPLADPHLPPDLDLRIERVVAPSAHTSETLQTDELWVPASATSSRPSAVHLPLARAQRQPLETAKTVSMLLIGFAFLLPTASGPPWSLLLAPAEVTFIAFVSLLLMAVVHVPRFRPPTRHKLALGLALLLVPFAVLTIGDSVAADHFDGQSLVTHLGHTPLLAAALLLGAASFVAGLTLAPTSNNTAYRLVTGIGLALLITVALVPMSSTDTSGDAVPLASAFASMGESPMIGDRIAAFALIPPLVVACLAMVVLFGPLRRFGLSLGVAAWISLSLPLVVLSLFAFRSTHWLEILAPLKTTAYLAGLTLFLAAALGALLDRSFASARRDPG